MNAAGPRTVPGGAPPDATSQLPVWDSPAVLVALVIVTLVVMIAAVKVDYAWRPETEARETARIKAAQAQALAASPRPLPAPAPPMEVGPAVRLTDLQPLRMPDWPVGGLGVNALPDGGPIRVWGSVRPEGLVMAPGGQGVASVEYALDGRFESFGTRPAACDAPRVRGASPLAFRIFVDGRMCWSSNAVGTGEIEFVSVPVTGARVLRLEVHCAGSTFTAGPGVWLTPRLVPAAQPAGH